MLNRFKEKFGLPKDTVVLMDDWSENMPKKYNINKSNKNLGFAKCIF
jgi:hypothetical protein